MIRKEVKGLNLKQYSDSKCSQDENQVFVEKKQKLLPFVPRSRFDVWEIMCVNKTIITVFVSDITKIMKFTSNTDNCVVTPIVSNEMLYYKLTWKSGCGVKEKSRSPESSNTTDTATSLFFILICIIFLM